jgi:hypothetical protein
MFDIQKIADLRHRLIEIKKEYRKLDFTSWPVMDIVMGIYITEDGPIHYRLGDRLFKNLNDLECYVHKLEKQIEYARED